MTNPPPPGSPESQGPNQANHELDSERTQIVSSPTPAGRDSTQVLPSTGPPAPVYGHPHGGARPPLGPPSFGGPPSGSVPSGHAAQPPPPRSSRARLALIWSAVAVLLIAGLVGTYFATQNDTEPAPPRPSADTQVVEPSGDAASQSTAEASAESSGQLTAEATPSDEGIGNDDGEVSEQDLKQARRAANDFYALLEAEDFDAAVAESCDDLQDDGSEVADELQDRYAGLAKWTITLVEPSGDGDGGVIVTSKVRSNDGNGVDLRSESLLFIDEGGWHYCGEA